MPRAMMSCPISEKGTRECLPTETAKRKGVFCLFVAIGREYIMHRKAKMLNTCHIMIWSVIYFSLGTEMPSKAFNVKLD